MFYLKNSGHAFPSQGKQSLKKLFTFDLVSPKMKNEYQFCKKFVWLPVLTLKVRLIK